MASSKHTVECIPVREPPAVIEPIAILAESPQGAKRWFQGQYDGKWRAAELPGQHPFYVRCWRIPYENGGVPDFHEIDVALQTDFSARLFPLPRHLAR